MCLELPSEVLPSSEANNTLANKSRSTCKQSYAKICIFIFTHKIFVSGRVM